MLFAAGATTPSEPFFAIVIAAVLFGLGRPIIRRVAAAEGEPWLVRILTLSLLLHLASAPAQIWVVDHLYNGVADWLRYDHQGALLEPGFRHFNFSLAPGNGRGIIGDNAVAILVAVIFSILGINQLAAFFVFSWIAFVGLVFFYRAFCLTFAGANHRRYARLLFFLPSLIFWTSDVSKESIMTFSVGLTAFGAARMLARRRGGFPLVILGVAAGILVRPNELLLLMGGFAIAMMILPPGDRRTLGGVRRLGTILSLCAMLGLAVFLTLHYLHGAGGSFSLSQISQNNQGTGVGAGHGSSVVHYSANPAAYPKDVYYVLFDPLPITAHGAGELVASLENSVLLAVLLLSLRRLRILPRVAFARPYVMLCAIYSAGFFYTFAALGNLGLITRERTLLFPLLLVIFSIPIASTEARQRERRDVRAPQRAADGRSTRHGPPLPYEWELKRRGRLARRRTAPSPAARGAPGRAG